MITHKASLQTLMSGNFAPIVWGEIFLAAKIERQDTMQSVPTAVMTERLQHRPNGRFNGGRFRPALRSY